MKKIRSCTGTALFAVIMLICLYYMNDGYFDTIIAKTRAFYVSTVIAVVTCIVMDVIASAKGLKREEYGRNPVLRAMLAFFMSYLISALICGNTESAFTGDVGWNVGIIAYFCGLLMYLVMKDLGTDTDLAAVVLSTGSIPFFLLAALHGAGVDLFSLHADLLKDEQFNYISTAGNIDVYAGIVSLFVPVIAAFYLKTGKTWLLTSIFAAGMGLSFAGVDSGYIGIFGGLAVLFIMGCNRRSPLVYMNRVVMTLSGSFVAAELIQQVNGGIFPPAKYISFFMNKYYLALILLCITVVIELALGLHDRYFALSPWIMLLLVMAVIALAILFFVHGVDKSERFGNSRLLIWQKAVQVYSDGGVREKLFGIGPSMFGAYSRGVEIGGRNVANCHSEILEHLVCGGVVTLACYIAIAAAVVWKVYRARRVSPFFFGLAGYFFQAQINNPQNMLLPFVCIFLAVI